VTTVNSLQLRYPPEQVGLWEEVGGDGAINNPSDGAYLRAVFGGPDSNKVSSSGPSWSAGEADAYHAWPVVPFDPLIPDSVANTERILRVRIRIRARMANPGERGYLWAGNRLNGGMTTRIGPVEGTEWTEYSGPWRDNINTHSWREDRLRAFLVYLGRTRNTGEMRVSRVWIDVERASTPAPIVTGPPSQVTGTSRPDVTWKTDGTFRQAGWQVQVFPGTRSSLPSSGAVAEGGSVYRGRPLHKGMPPGRAVGLHRKLEAASAVRWTIDRTLDPAATYTVFVRVARQWGNQPLWSRWVSRTFSTAMQESAPPPPAPPVVEPPADPEPVEPQPFDPDNVDLEAPAPDVTASAFALTVRWPSQLFGFGQASFGLAPFGGGTSLIDVESSDNEDGPWIDRGRFVGGADRFVDPFVAFGADRWYRLRSGVIIGDHTIMSAPSAPVDGRMGRRDFTATITSVDTNRSVRVHLRGLPLTPTWANRMTVMPAADLGASTAQGQPAVPGYEGRLWIRHEQFAELQEMLTDAGTLVWRDTYRYRFPFVWTGDMRVRPVIGKNDTAHVVDVTMTRVPWPEGVH